MPGTQRLPAAQGLRVASDVQTVEFDLGDIGRTTSFYFLVENAGGRPITSITIGSSNPAFQVSPTFLQSLPAGGSGLVPIIRLTAIHGAPVTGIGYAPLMPAGIDSTTFGLTGETTDSTGATIPVNLYASVTVNALVMDAVLYDGTSPVDLAHPSSETQDLRRSPQSYSDYYLDSLHTSIQNSGDVAVTVLIWPPASANSNVPLAGPYQLDKGATLQLPDSFPAACNGGCSGSVVLDLNSNGVVSDPLRLRPDVTGHVFLGLHKPFATAAPTSSPRRLGIARRK